MFWASRFNGSAILTDINTQLKDDDIITQVRRAIDDNDVDQAIGIIDSLTSYNHKIRVLRELAGDVKRSLDLALTRNHFVTMGDSRSRETRLARDRVYSLAIIRTYADALSMSLAKNLNLAHDLALKIGFNIDSQPDQSFELSRALNRSFVTQDFELSRALNRSFTTNTVILLTLPELIDHQYLETQVEDQASMSADITATLIGLDRLTPIVLANQVAPYLQALVDTQAVITDLTGSPSVEPAIRSLSHRNPLDFNLDGVGDAINSIKEDVIPWRRKHAQEMAKRNEAKAEVEIEAIRTQTDQTLQSTETDEERQIRLEERRLALEEKRLALREREMAIEEKRITLALSIIDKLNPQMAEAQRLAYANRLLEPLKVITESPLKLIAPPPSTLPEMGESAD